MGLLLTWMGPSMCWHGKVIGLISEAVVVGQTDSKIVMIDVEEHVCRYTRVRVIL